MSDTAYVSALPNCQMNCGSEHPADYDLNLALVGRRSWAYVCESFYAAHGSPALGTGRGQRLVVGEKPDLTDADKAHAIRAAVEAGDFEAAEDLIGDGDPAEWL